MTQIPLLTPDAHAATDHTGITGVGGGGGGAAELAYVEITSPLAVTATSEATGQTVVSAGAVSFDGSTRVCIEFYAPWLYQDSDDVGLIIDLSDGGAGIGRLAGEYAPSSGDHRGPCLLRRFLTPSAGSHTYSIQAWKTGGNPEVGAGAGGSGAWMPAYIRITEA